MALDHTRDLTGAETHRLTSIYPPPPFVKQASHERLFGDPETLPSQCYGDPAQRLYPCHSAPAAWMSSLFFYDKQAELEPKRADAIEQRLRAAAAHFGVAGAVESLRKRAAALAGDELAALPDTDFALVWRGEAGESERHYPLRNAAEVKMAEHWLCRYRDELAYADRSQVARKILEKAAQHSVGLEQPDVLGQIAGYGVCGSGEAAAALEKRATLTLRSHPQLAQQLRKLAAAVRDGGIGPRDQALREKLAEQLDQFDRETRLSRLYAEGGLERPEETLFKLTEKHARDFVDAHVQLTSGTIYEKSALDQLPLSHIRDWMGSDFAAEVSVGDLTVDTEKLATLAATLPRSDAELFDTMSQLAGVQPFARDKAAQAQGFSLEELAELAMSRGAPLRSGSFAI